MAFQKARAITLPILASATVDIVASRFITVTSVGATLAGAAGDAVGISLEAIDVSEAIAGNTTQALPVALLDGAVLEVEAGAAVAIGVRVMSDSTGRAITATGAGARVLGISMSVAGAAGETLTIVAQKAAGEFVS